MEGTLSHDFTRGTGSARVKYYFNGGGILKGDHVICATAVDTFKEDTLLCCICECFVIIADLFHAILGF